MQLKKLLAPFLAGVCALSLCSCGKDPKPPTLPEPNDYYETQDSIDALFNAAIDKLNDAGSYKMIGSYVSAAEVTSSGELTSPITPIDLTYQNGAFLVDATEAGVYPHSTYFDGQRYYYTLLFTGEPLYGYSNANDSFDFTATDYLRPINGEILTEPNIIENKDGSKILTFKIPFTIYESPAMISHLGILVDDTHHASDLAITATINADGYITTFLISFMNTTAFGDDTINQEIVASMALSDYGTAVLTPPANLSIYEDWTEETPELPSEGVGNHTPEDMQ